MSIIEIGDGVIEVLATNGDTHLGGDDFDAKIVDYMIAEIKRNEGVDLSNDKMAPPEIKGSGREGRRRSFPPPPPQHHLPFITATNEGPKHFDMNLTRAKFDELTRRPGGADRCSRAERHEGRGALRPPIWARCF